mmetsp:Transcript_2916/g.4545  ORF Transcript_2916/g.4545 Transcript_2916/m.4545 type:complete len:102 (+) Transcript_2916:200-505(+)
MAGNLEEMSREQLVKHVLSLQETLSDLTSRVDQIKSENGQLKEENDILKEYTDNLMGKVSNLQGLGTIPPSPVAFQRTKESAVTVRVNDHIGELTAPAMED